MDAFEDMIRGVQTRSGWRYIVTLPNGDKHGWFLLRDKAEKFLTRWLLTSRE